MDIQKITYKNKLIIVGYKTIAEIPIFKYGLMFGITIILLASLINNDQMSVFGVVQALVIAFVITLCIGHIRFNKGLDIKFDLDKRIYYRGSRIFSDQVSDQDTISSGYFNHIDSVGLGSEKVEARIFNSNPVMKDGIFLELILKNGKKFYLLSYIDQAEGLREAHELASHIGVKVIDQR